MRFLKGVLAAALVLTMTACSTKEPTKEDPLKILGPQGAPALALLPLYGEDNVAVETVAGSDALLAALSKKDSEYDAVVAPINVGATLIEKEKTDYVLDSVVTWGNLYIVGTDESALSEEGMFAAFGEAAVPQKVLMSSMDMDTIKGEIKYFGSANEVSGTLLAKKANAGLLAEPAVTATIAKAKQQGIELKVLKDLQKEYQQKNNTPSYGYPQAALFVKKGSEEKLSSAYDKMEEFANKTSLEDENAIVEAVQKATPEKLGIPNAEIAQKSWKRQNIRVVKAVDVKDDINTFLKQFNINITDDAYTK